jgi:hypothetical protein
VRAPDLAALRRTADIFNGYANVDVSWHRFVDDTAPGVDLARPEHRALLLRWLNSWGCRIRYPREGEPAPFDDGIAAWWKAHSGALPTVELARLSDVDIDALGAAYADLAAVAVSAGRVRRTLGPTAAAKALYALRPTAVMPWDAAIAARLHGARDAAAFAAHQRLGRGWARSLPPDTPALVGRGAIPLAKVLDEHLYVTLTARR